MGEGGMPQPEWPPIITINHQNHLQLEPMNNVINVNLHRSPYHFRKNDLYCIFEQLEENKLCNKKPLELASKNRIEMLLKDESTDMKNIISVHQSMYV
jgi:septum formation inhibitor MinC